MITPKLLKEKCRKTRHNNSNGKFWSEKGSGLKVLTQGFLVLEGGASTGRQKQKLNPLDLLWIEINI